MELLVSKWIGLEETIRLARDRRKELLCRLPGAFIDEAYALSGFLDTGREEEILKRLCGCFYVSIGEHGIFGELWRLADEAGLGLDVIFSNIPIRQETIEICEVFGMNPYRLPSGGSLLIVSNAGYAVRRELYLAGISCSSIGCLSEGNDRVVLYKDRRSFLVPPERF